MSMILKLIEEDIKLHPYLKDKYEEQDKALKAKDAEIADLKQRLERLEKLIQ